jgi:putative SOS response-associated peptidase YedK
MCGRYTLTVDKSTIEKRFGAKFYIARPAYDWTPTFNAAPSQLLPIIRTHHPERIELAKWGFVHEDWKNSKMRPQNNARLETADEKPMFHASFRGRRCLVLADSFYEWQTLANGKKQPYRIMLKPGDGRVFMESATFRKWLADRGCRARSLSVLGRPRFLLATGPEKAPSSSSRARP